MLRAAVLVLFVVRDPRHELEVAGFLRPALKEQSRWPTPGSAEEIWIVGDVLEATRSDHPLVWERGIWRFRNCMSTLLIDGCALSHKNVLTASSFR